MLARRLWLLLVCLSVALPASLIAQAHGPAAGADFPILKLEGLGKGAAPLNGPWQFHLGDDAAWARPAIDDAAEHNGWEQLSADKPWGAQGHASYTGFAWYRRHIQLELAPDTPSDVALFLPPVDDAYEVYWNGSLVGRAGGFPPHLIWYFRPPPRTFGLGPVRTGVLAFRVYKVPLGSFDSGIQGGFNAPPVMGSPEAIEAIKAASDFRWLQRNQFRFAIDSLYALVSLLCFLTWLRDRREWLLFWMAGYGIAPVVIDVLLNLRIPFRTNVALGLAQPFFGLIYISLWYVLVLILRLDESRRLMRTVRVLASIESGAFLLDGMLILIIPFSMASWTVQIQWADGIFTAVFTTLQATPLVLVVYAMLRGRKLSAERWLVAICAFIANFIPAFRSALEQGSRYTHWTLADKIATPLFTVNGNAINAQTISSTLLLLALVFAVYRYLAEERERQAAIEQEFRNARELQQVLIPEDLPEIPGYTLTTAYKPASEVGGDFFQIIPLEGGATLIVLGDVSGKGLKAAMAVSLIVGAIRTFAETTSSPAEILAGLNRRLFGRLHGGFATAIALRLDSDGSGVMASAGHTSPYVNDEELSLPGAFPLGLAATVEYEETRFQLKGSEHLALYTDGLLEARSSSGELFSFERLKTLFAAKPTAEQATEAAVAFGQDDDITVLTLSRAALPAR